MSAQPRGPAAVAEIGPLPFEVNDDPKRAKRLRGEAAWVIRSWRKLDLPNATIRGLLKVLREENAAIQIEESWPTAGADKAALRKLGQMLLATGNAIAELSPKARAEFATAVLKATGDPHAAVTSSGTLHAVAAHLMARTSALPTQGRRRSFPTLISRIAKILEPLSPPMAVTARQGTPFYRVCEGAFKIAGIRSRAAKAGTEKNSSQRPPSPGASIRAFLHPRNESPSAGRDQ